MKRMKTISTFVIALGLTLGIVTPLLAQSLVANRIRLLDSNNLNGLSMTNVAADLVLSGGLTMSGSLSLGAGSNIVGLDTLGGNPTFPANAIGFGTTGLLLECATGGAGNALEGLLTLVYPTADRTRTLPNA